MAALRAEGGGPRAGARELGAGREFAGTEHTCSGSWAAAAAVVGDGGVSGGGASGSGVLGGEPGGAGGRLHKPGPLREARARSAERRAAAAAGRRPGCEHKRPLILSAAQLPWHVGHHPPALAAFLAAHRVALQAAAAHPSPFSPHCPVPAAAAPLLAAAAAAAAAHNAAVGQVELRWALLQTGAAVVASVVPAMWPQALLRAATAAAHGPCGVSGALFNFNLPGNGGFSAT
jgi:hypothetical protein